MDFPFNGEGELDPQCPDGDIVDTNMEVSYSFEGAPEVGEEDEELGRVDFKPVIVDLVPKPMEEEVADPMDVEDDLQQ